MLTTTQKALVLVLIPVCFELVFIFIMAFAVDQIASDLQKMEHSRDAIENMYRTENWVISTCIWALSDTQNTKKDEKRLDYLEKEFSQLSFGKVSDNRFPELSSLQDDVGELTKAISALVAAKRREYTTHEGFPRQLIYTSFLDMRSIADRIIAIEKRVADSEPAELSRFRSTLMALMATGVAFSALVSFALAHFLTRDIIDRLLRLKESAHRLAAREPVLPPALKGDELASLESIIYESSRSLQDIRERENAVLDNAADVICSLDHKLRFTGVNAAAFRDWSFSEDELLGKALAAIVVPDDVDETRAQFQLVSDGPGAGEIQNRIRTKSGDSRDVVWSVKWNSVESQYFCVIHDVTELRNLQKMKQQFLAIAGHDLRSPLASVSITLERLLDEQNEPLTPAARKELTKTRDILSRLVDLVNELLELEKLESGKFVLATNCVSAFDVCVLACETLDAMAARAGVTVVKPKNDFALLGDERRLVQSVVNLLSNAIKFSPRNSTITLSLERTTADDAHLVQMRISDQGPGITEDDRALIFEKFSQSKTNSNVSIKSTGLGLAIVKAIAYAHGGDVGIESEVGKGSTFWLSIPEFIDQEDEA